MVIYTSRLKGAFVVALDLIDGWLVSHNDLTLNPDPKPDLSGAVVLN